MAACRAGLPGLQRVGAAVEPGGTRSGVVTVALPVWLRGKAVPVLRLGCSPLASSGPGAWWCGLGAPAVRHGPPCGTEQRSGAWGQAGDDRPHLEGAGSWWPQWAHPDC
ncbi:hypothetical protein NDU88_003997 [Pleurodeles waltl]|uniref:Uncharacterized protein n=1 Tax=Pleurodeles waltl TaxID=8319 RepID=A0AAV7UE66_PLEWA|nr:hypothetical protein NDU88_003997 [Pleurodeles waltl]